MISQKTRYLCLKHNYIVFEMEERNRTLGEFIIEHQNSFQYSTGEFNKFYPFLPTSQLLFSKFLA